MSNLNRQRHLYRNKRQSNRTPRQFPQTRWESRPPRLGMKSHPAKRHPADGNLRQPAAHMISPRKKHQRARGRHSRRSTAETQPSGRQPDDHVARGSLLVRVRRVGKGRAAVGPPAPEQAEANHGHDPANRDDDANRHAEVRPEVQVLVFAEREAKLHQGPEDRRRRLGAPACVSFFASSSCFPGALNKQGRDSPEGRGCLSV